MDICLAILKDKTNNTTVGAKFLANNGDIVNLPTSDILRLKDKLRLGNAVIDKNGFTSGRVFPKNRDDCKELLELLELDFYDEWAIVKKTGASLMTDPWWLRIEDGWTYENNTVKGIIEKENREYRAKHK